MSSTNTANFPAANANTPAAPEATTNRNATASPTTPTRTVIVRGVAGGMTAAGRPRPRRSGGGGGGGAAARVGG